MVAAHATARRTIVWADLHTDALHLMIPSRRTWKGGSGDVKGYCSVTVQWATVVPGSESPLDEGTSGAIRCVLVLPDQSLSAAVLKRDPPELVFAEILAAFILRAWSLPVPDPYLVREGPSVWYASADAGYPNLKKRVGLESFPEGSQARSAAFSLACQLAKSLPTAPLAAAADEAIDNRDSNLGNILWDGSQEMWIDHALALGNGEDVEGDKNKLCEIAVFTGDHSEFMASAISHWTSFDRGVIAEQSMKLNGIYDTSAWQALIGNRLAELGMRLVRRFPAPPGLFDERVDDEQ
jgi:hypothetical protein